MVAAPTGPLAVGDVVGTERAGSPVETAGDARNAVGSDRLGTPAPLPKATAASTATPAAAERKSRNGRRCCEVGT